MLLLLLKHVPTVKCDLAKLRGAFEKAVIKRLMYVYTSHNILIVVDKIVIRTDVPYGALLSGGLDSSLVAAVANRYAAKRVEEDMTVQGEGLFEYTSLVLG